MDHFEAFQKWLIDNGAEFPDLYLKRYTDNMRGVHASRPIESYSTVVAIPLKCLITDHMGRTDTELGRLMFAPGTRCSFSTPNLIAVVVYMLTDMENPDSFFQPYYRILPSDYNQYTHPPSTTLPSRTRRQPNSRSPSSRPIGEIRCCCCIRLHRRCRPSVASQRS